MSTTILVFPHSHYCEKARWALDFKGIEYEARTVMPGFHVRTLKKYTDTSSTVPVLLDNETVVQGSSNIIDYLDARHPDRLLTPLDSNESRECQSLEKTMDEELGVNLRQILYSSLLAYPDFIRHCFVHPLPAYKQWIFRRMYPKLRSLIYQRYVKSDEEVARARLKFKTAMEDLETRLSGRNFLVGDGFSRADLSICSMLSLLVMPEQHPFPWPEIPDDELRKFIHSYQGHPVYEWVQMMYREYR